MNANDSPSRARDELVSPDVGVRLPVVVAESKSPGAGALTGPSDQLTLTETVMQLRDLNERLIRALESRIVIEQAKGILAERYALSCDEAFRLLRDSARSSRTRLRSLAEAVASDRTRTPDIVLAALARPERWGVRRPRDRAR
jgi:hypothetical protein